MSSKALPSVETVEDVSDLLETELALKDYVRTYDALDETATIEGLNEELDNMAADAPVKQAKHLREAKEDAQFFMQSGICRMLQGFKKEFGDALDS